MRKLCVDAAAAALDADACGWLEIPTSDLRLAVRVYERLYRTQLCARDDTNCPANNRLAYFNDAEGRAVFLQLRAAAD